MFYPVIKIRFRIIALFLIFQTYFVSNIFSQKLDFTNEAIWQKKLFATSPVSGIKPMNNGIHYTSLIVSGNLQFIVKYDYKTGNAVDTFLKGNWLKTNDLIAKDIEVESYQFSKDENSILIETESEAIYRHSSKANYYIYNIKEKKVKHLSDDGKQMYAAFSPNNFAVAFVRNNNLFIKDLFSSNETTITNDGKFGSIINGAVDWVYEEEFSMDKGFAWNVDGTKIAYYIFDESNVKEFEFSMYEKNLYPESYKYKYPKAGEANSIVSIYIYDLLSQQSTKVETGAEVDQYLPRINWTQDANTLSFQRMNRLQNKLELLTASAVNGKSKVILTENSNTYVDVNDDLFFMQDKASFIWNSARSGFNHLYLYDISGKLINTITEGNWQMMQMYGYNAISKKIYYASNEPNTLEKHIFSILLTGKGKQKLTAEAGYNEPNFNSSFTYFILTHSSANKPPTQNVCYADGSTIRKLTTNESVLDLLKKYNFSEKKFFTIKNDSSTFLNAYIIKPANFDTAKKYPVIMYVYGGSGNNTVLNRWGGANFMWQNMMAQKGYIIVSVDNRGTELRGEKFLKCIYKQLGNLELQDQTAAAKYLATLRYVDASRIGIQGWSFGGYMSSLAITKQPEIFKAAVAIAPVTNWRYYDNIYTERFLQRPQENASGYDENSPINFVAGLKGKYLLIHGTADDNVHFQNSIEMINALQKANKQFELMIYPDKSHSITGGKTRQNLYEKVTDFWLRNL